ncbi:hypothetical protein TFLX_02136 [Thermoflexales bacterium]|nr:hypothetical protein TFLX_02136 [Thermoflexales bacterium]
MRRIHTSILKGLSIVVVVSLIAQLLPPMLFVKPAYAAPRIQQTDSVSLSPIEEVLQALDDVERSADESAFQAALHRVTRAWERVLAAEQQKRLTLAATQDRMSARGVEEGEERLAALLADQQRQLNALTAYYDKLIVVAPDGRKEASTAAAEFRVALKASTELPAAPAPNFELLPNRPAPQAASVRMRPALSADVKSGQAMASAPEAVESPPTNADYAPTEDAALTPEIQALASELNHDPVAIFAFVRNNIAFEPYFGSHKGSLLTLWERSGNDMDIASLTIALLRASGFYVRYVQGTVAVDETRAQNWVGNAPDLATAGSILATGGVPVALTPDGFLVKQHVWIEVYDPERRSVDFNYNGVVDVGDIQRVAALLGTSDPRYDFDRDGTVDRDDVNRVVQRWRQLDPGGVWVPLDASFKQFTFTEPIDLSVVTSFSTTQYITEVQTSSSLAVSDVLQSLSAVPMVSSPDLPGISDYNTDFADFKLQQAVSATLDYINANPNLTNADLLGGAYIVTETISTLPLTLPLTILTGEPITRYGEVPSALRDKLTVSWQTEFGSPLFSYQASFPALANKRVTVSYVAATPSDQAIIDSNGGTLLTTPPIVNLVPVLQLNGTEVARGSAVLMGTRQTRSLTFTDANGRSNTVQNSVSAGDTVAIGLAYGRTSAGAIEASQQRLAAARAALPTTPDGNPDPQAPGNMAEPVVGEMLHLSLQAYFNQLDAYSELSARGRHVRWFRALSGGVAMQSLVFSYGFGGVPVQTLGGGMGFDIQQNVVAALSLRDNPRDEVVFLQVTGYFGSALEHSLFENLGRGAVSTIRLLSLALARGITVYRIDATNRDLILPRLQLSAAVESAIVTALNQGKIVTVSERELQVNDWSGVGYLVLDPATGAAGYLISGGLAGNVSTISGGSLWDVLTTIGAYAWLAINLGLDLWGVWAGIALLLVPEPTLLTKLAGIALIVGNLVSLGFDVADLSDLLSGDVSAQQYIGEQLTGLIIEAILKRVGLAAAARILDEIGSSAMRKVVQQIDNITEGAADQLIRRGFNDADIVRMTQRGLDSEGALRTMDELADRFGIDEARRLLNNDYIADKGALEAVARAAVDAPPAPGLTDTIEKALSRGDFGYAYELKRAVAHGSDVVGYGQRIDVDFQRITGFNPDGSPILGPLDRQALEGDVVLQGNIFVDAKHGAQGNLDLHIWNQIQKAQAAIDAGLINGYQFECSASMGQRMRDWAAINAPDVQFIINLGDGYR